MLVHSSIRDDILTTALFFATADVMLGFYLSDRPAPLALFFSRLPSPFSAALCIQSATPPAKTPSPGSTTATPLSGLRLHCRSNTDWVSSVLTTINTWPRYSRNPASTRLWSWWQKKIRELEPETQIYRCGADEFIVIFPAAEKGTSFARVDNIRRSVAASEFLLSGRKKSLKLTVSCSVADKKRSDANVFEVFMRARKIFAKNLQVYPEYHFSGLKRRYNK